MNLTALIDERIQRALRALRMPYRARLSTLNGEPGLQLAQGEALAGEKVQAAEVLQQFGLCSGIPQGSQLIVLPLAGQSSASVVIATENTAYRLKVGPGEVCLYSQEGAKVHIKNGRLIEIDCDDLKLTAKNTVLIEAGQGVTVDTPQTTITGNLTATGERGSDIGMTGTVSLNGSLTSTGDQVAGGISQIGHTHPGDSGGTTGPAQ
jgi:phage baseplate assembly protein V